MRHILFIFIGLTITSPVLAQPHSGGFRGEYSSAAVQGDLSQLVGRIDATPEAGDDPFLAEVRERFGRDGSNGLEATGSELLDDVLTVYRDFWRECMRGEIDLDHDEEILARRLQPILEAHDPAFEGDALKALPGILEDRDLHVQDGRTRPLMDLYVWKNEDVQSYSVDLGDTTVSVAVHFMDDFVSPGWIHFASLGRAAAGGWANEKGLFCRAEDYDVESEQFTASYLKHESRHYADYEMFPALEQTDLEYRAKLTELMHADITLPHLLGGFRSMANPNPESPHALASYAVVRELEGILGGDPSGSSTEEIHAAAEKLLGRHSQELRREGAASVTGLIESRYGPTTNSNR